MKIYKLPLETKAILFDIDSTLYTNANYAFEQVDVQIRHFADLRKISHKEGRELIENYRTEWAKNHGGEKTSLGNTLKAFGIPIEESIEWRKNLIEPKNFLQKDQKLIETLTELEKKYKIAAVTNNPSLPAKKTLQCLGVENFFRHLVALDTCSVSKPHPAPYEYASKLLNIPFSNCVSVGDRFDIDLRIPLEMGMGGILVSGVEDVYKLPKVLGAV